MTKVPKATLCVLAVTGLVTATQFVDPRILALLRRSPEGLARGEWWRLITPLFVQADGWRQISVNFLGISVAGYLVERLFGSAIWLLVYFSSGLAGEFAGYAWDPNGAGASIAVAGLIGSLAAWLVLVNRQPPAIFGSAVVLVGALVLALHRDIHGPPVMVGSFLAAMVLWRRAKAAADKQRQG